MPDMPLPGVGSPLTPPGQNPVGSSPATSPVPNKGMEAAAMAKLALVVRQLEMILPMLGAGSEIGAVVLKTLTNLSKLVPSGAVSQGVEQSALQNLIMKMRQQAPQIAAMRAASSGGAPPSVGAGGAAPPPVAA